MRLIYRRELQARIEEKIETEPLNGEGKLVLWGLLLMIITLLTASTFKAGLRPTRVPGRPCDYGGGLDQEQEQSS